MGWRYLKLCSLLFSMNISVGTSRFDLNPAWSAYNAIFAIKLLSIQQKGGENFLETSNFSITCSCKLLETGRIVFSFSRHLVSTFSSIQENIHWRWIVKESNNIWWFQSEDRLRREFYWTSERRKLIFVLLDARSCKYVAGRMFQQIFGMKDGTWFFKIAFNLKQFLTAYKARLIDVSHLIAISNWLFMKKVE